MLGSQGRSMTSPSYMSEEQMGQQSHASPSIQSRRALFGSSRSGECAAIQEDNSHSVPTASYLKDLRANKTRPIGSRPPPPSKFGSLRRTETETTGIPTATANHERPPLPQTNSMPTMIPQTTAYSRPSIVGRNSPFSGRALARTPSATPSAVTNDERIEKSAPGASQGPMYKEQGSRWMEKQEAHSLRTALEDMDIAEEQRVHNGAQDEAAELVWKHRNPHSAFANPEAPYGNPNVKKDYNSHLQKGSYSRRHSREVMPQMSTRSSMSGSERPSLDASLTSKKTSLDSTRTVDTPKALSNQKSRTPSSNSGKNYGELAAAVKNDIDSARRRTSSGSRRILSGEKKVYMHPDDKIFEDPQEEATSPKKQQPVIPIPDLRPAPMPVQSTPSLIRKNPFSRVRMQQERLERTQSAPVLPQAASKMMNRIEIQRNPPSQSRNAGYTSNESLPLTPTIIIAEDDANDSASPQLSPTKDGKEIRGDDIRAATSKQRSARSPNLPQPTAVSDKVGRPIVSFDQGWKQQKEIVLEETRVPALTATPSAAATPPRSNSALDSPRSSPFNRQSIPRIDPPRDNGHRSSYSPAPTINAPGRSTSPMPPIPTICLPDDPSVPSIVLPEEPEAASAIPVFSSIPSFNIEPPKTPAKRPSSFSGPPTMARPPMRSSATITPIINFEPPSKPTRSAAPSISVNGPGFSSRPIPSLPPSTTTHRPLPTPTQQPPLHHHANTSPIPKSSPHYTPSLRQSRALCAHCALPIAGRVLSAAGQRLHPSCFNCHECDTNLEHVAFHPEPESQRALRLKRITARQTRYIPDHLTADELYDTEEADGEPSLRFYCALDFHEMFSPRCKSCKTPIEGEVIVACGAEWHAGHFFCAQCGDPFDASTPFVEKDGYAWCCDCHTNRYSAKCRKCRKPVTDVVVKALGSEWHANCFCCLECGGEFEDGRYFLRGESEDPVCVRCEEMRLKA